MQQCSPPYNQAPFQDFISFLIFSDIYDDDDDDESWGRIELQKAALQLLRRESTLWLNTHQALPQLAVLYFGVFLYFSISVFKLWLNTSTHCIFVLYILCYTHVFLYLCWISQTSSLGYSPLEKFVSQYIWLYFSPKQHSPSRLHSKWGSIVKCNGAA